jgi:hypothetical protein
MAYTTTTQQLFTTLVPAFVRSAKVDIAGPVLFQIEGDNGGSWLVDFHARTVTEGKLPAGATVKAIVRAQERDFMALVEGRMSAADGLLTKRLHLAGEAAALAVLMDALEQLRASLP